MMKSLNLWELATHKKAVIIGPEGGFTTDEVLLANQKNVCKKCWDRLSYERTQQLRWVFHI